MHFSLDRALCALALSAALAPVALAQDDRPVFKAVERIRGEIAQKRGLTFQARVPVGLKTPDEIRTMMMSEFEKEAPVEKFQKEEKVVKAFGLIPRDYDLRAKLIEFMAENIGGYYDPEAKELFLVDMSQNPQMQGAQGMQGNMEEMVMAHELHHALQDQNFDLQRWMNLLEDEDDRLQAYKSLVEGEAQLVGMTHMFKREVDLAQMNRMQEAMLQFAPEGKKLRETPAFLVENMMFPYTQGAEFVQQMQKKHGWERITAAFRDPPTSTEQILHPEKFLGAERDEPVEVLLSGIAGPLGKGAEELDTGTMGEFNVSLLLRALGVSKKDSAKAAAGWDGDAYAGFQTKDGRVVVVWLTTWDSADEAAEFEKLYGGALQKQGRTDHVERRGSEVLWIHGASPAELPLLVRRGFAAVKATISFQPLPGFVERPSADEFGAPAAGQSSTPAPASPSSPVAPAPAADWVTGKWEPKDLRTVQGPGASVSFAWPEGFTQGQAAGRVLCNLDGPNGARVQVVAAPATGSLEEMARGLEKQLPLAVEGFELKSSAVVTRRGQTTHELEFTAQGRRTRQHTFLVGGTAFTVAVSAPSERFEALMPAFGRVLASVAVAVGQKQSY